MEEIFKKSYKGENLYARLCNEEAQSFMKCYWSDCVLSMEEIMEAQKEGETAFIVVFRKLGAELFPVKKGVSERFSFYKKNEKGAKVFLLDYDSECVYSLSWDEAETILGNKVLRRFYL